MKNNFKRLKLILILFVSAHSLCAQTKVWTDVPQTSIVIKQFATRSFPKQFRTLRLDTASFISFVAAAPKEFTEAGKTKPLILTIPMPDGSYSRFKIVETEMLEPGLAAQFPDIKSYGGQGIEDPYATIKIDFTALGFHAMIVSPINGSVFIDPYSQEDVVHYISYNKKDYLQSTPFIEDELNLNKPRLDGSSIAQRTVAAACIGGTLRRYRLAVACTAEYAVAAVGSQLVTKAQALSAIVTTVNRVNGVYENEVAIRMVLVANNDKIVFTNTTTQPFKGNNNAITLINESQKVIDSLIGSPNYDIGHTFSTGAGGYAGVGVVCDNREKAKGVSGDRRPVGDPFNIDYVAHEIGHQFGANHTFNASTGNCKSPNGSPTTNAEPGSGATIMGYAGICESSNDLQPNTMPYFHGISLDEITNYINSSSGSSCAVPINTGNRPPLVDAGNDYVIPKSTPFVLIGSATDADGDPLTYSWEEFNVGGPFGNWNNPSGDAPIFRSFVPVTSPQRYFPKLSDIISNTTTIGEILPSYARILKFRLTARDNKVGGGGVCSDETNVTVAENAGPFVVTFPNTATTLDVGSFSTVTWDVAKTNTAPVNCSRVNIELSIDGGLTYPVTLLSNTPNDGMEEIIIPNNVTTAARIRVRAVGNVFFDISNVNFTIRATSQVGFVFSHPLPVISCNNRASAAVIHTNELNKFSTPITLSASGNPAGTSVVFSTNPIKPGSSDTITITGDIPPGIYNITITGTADTVVKTRTIQFTIGLPVKTPVNLTPSNNSASHPLVPTFKWSAQPDAQYYSLHISTSSNFATSVQTINNIADTTFTLTTPLAPETQYYWRVISANACGTGPASTAHLFKTVAIVCADTTYSQNVPIKIIDSTINAITSTVNIPDGGVIQDVDVVGLRGTHSYVGDLIVSLTSPSNTSVLLFSKLCESLDNFNLNFDDEVAAKITCPLDSNQTGKPLQPLSAFDDENSTGTWKLTVLDSFAVDGGSLDAWGLRICTYRQTALPLNWLAFTAYQNENKTILLQWSTANEVNNHYYEIEKSIDGTTFTNFGKIAAGNSPGMQQYFFNDLKPANGITYYRLKQVDKDGTYTYSKIVKVYIGEAGAQYVVYPNPAVNKATVRILNEVKQLSIKLTDGSGKLVFQKNAGSVKAGQTFEIPVEGLSKGLYLMSLVTEKGISNEKLIVQ